MATSINPSDEALLDAEAAAEFLAKPVGTLSQWRYRGEGPPFYKLGRSVRYRLGDLRAFRDAHRINPRGGTGNAL